MMISGSKKSLNTDPTDLQNLKKKIKKKSLPSKEINPEKGEKKGKKKHNIGNMHLKI